MNPRAVVFIAIATVLGALIAGPTGAGIGFVAAATLTLVL